MRKIGVFLLVILCLVHCLPITAGATEEDSVVSGCSTLQAHYALGADQEYTGTAKAAILYELNTETLVYAHNPDVIINPTGLVKLLTALIVLEEGELDEPVTVKRSTLNSLAAGAKRVGLQVDDVLTVRDLLYCVMVASANDAAAVLAEHVAGSQAVFVEKMNARAATLGCVNTHFANVHGLQNDNQCSTARELAIITAEALKNQQFVEMFATVNYQLPDGLSCSSTLSTTNFLMDPDSKYYDVRVTGGKPAAATTADRSVICTAETENGRYLCVIISATAKTSGYSVTKYTNFTEATKLLDYGMKGFAVQQVLSVGQPFGMYEVAGGENSVVVKANQEVYALLPIDFDWELLQFRDVKDQQMLSAPLKAGTVVGSLQICYGSVIVGEVNLLACHDVAEKGTTIQAVKKGDGESLLLRIVKWGGVIFVVLVLMAGTGLVILRQVNKARHQKKINQRRQREQEGV